MADAQPETDRDELLRKLSRVTEQVADLPRDAFTERVQLRELQTSLRAALAQRGEGRTRDSLQGELRQLEKRLAEVLRDRPNVAAMNDGGQGGAGGAESQQMAWEYDEGRSRRPLSDRIAEIKRSLDELGDDPEPDEG